MQQAILTVDLGFGDAGKGSVVDFLTRDCGAHTVVRYNGGAQAGHRVVTSTGEEHVFAQFGSGALAGAATHLSRFMLVEPLAMLAEAAHLHTLGVDALALTTIDAQACVVTPFQRAANRLKEMARGAARHGSCGMGIGETAADALAYGARTLRVHDLDQPDALLEKLTFVRAINRAKVDVLRPALPADQQVADELAVLWDDDWLEWLIEAYRHFARRAQVVAGDHLAALLRRPGVVLFEGAQGVLLDEAYGFHPHTTWSDTTLRNAEHLLAEARYTGAVQRVGITRAYATRHGAGPFVTEDAALTRALPDAANGDGAWQQGFRVGWLDLVMLRYARAVVGALDYLAVTCLDRLAQAPALNICTHYGCDDGRFDRLPMSPVRGDLTYQAQLAMLLTRVQPVLTPLDDSGAVVSWLEDALQLPVGLVSTGPGAADKAWRSLFHRRQDDAPAPQTLKMASRLAPRREVGSACRK